MDIDLSAFSTHSGTPVNQFVYRLQHSLETARALAKDRLDHREQEKTWHDTSTASQVHPRHSLNDLVLLHTNHPQPGLHSIHKRTVTGPYTIIRILPPDTYVISMNGRENVVAGDRLARYHHPTAIPTVPTVSTDPTAPIESIASPDSTPLASSVRAPRSVSFDDTGLDSTHSRLHPSTTPLPPEDPLPDGVFEVETVLDRRVQRSRSRTAPRTLMYLVKWRGYDSSHNSWEPERNLEGCQDLLHEFLSLNPPRA